MGQDPPMKVDPARAAALAARLQAVQARIAEASAASAGHRSVRLVAVSKLKPANDILALHQSSPPVLHFGENYAQELRDKAALLPQTIRWHFIGGLQSNHCKTLARIPNLWCVSSIDAPKKALLLQAARAAFAQDHRQPDGSPLDPIRVHVQVNTSGEAAKSGCAPGDDTLALCRTIRDDCPQLRLCGLMTIGAIAHSREASTVDSTNPDFDALRAERDRVQAALGLPPDQPLELSMGMSDDFVAAIAAGSDEVRIGSTLFGLRPAKADAQLVV